MSCGIGSLLDGEIHVAYTNFFNTTTSGARIKTWQGATGYARSISFEHINFTNLENAIIINQYYCSPGGTCCIQNFSIIQKDAVHVINVGYANLFGTSSKSEAEISLNCSQSVPCTGIQINEVTITSISSLEDAEAVHINAHGETCGYVYLKVWCLSQPIVFS